MVIPLIDNNQINQQNTITVTRFIFSVLGSASITDNNLKSKLKKLPLLTSDGLKLAEECYLSEFYNPNSEKTIFLENIKIQNIINHEYYQPAQSKDEWRQFFLNIGVKELKGIDLIRKKISLLINNLKIITTNKNNLISITREIFNYRKQLNQDDFEFLRCLPLLLKNNQNCICGKDWMVACVCYMSNEYNPQQNLEDLFLTTDFKYIVSSEYIENKLELQDWKDFFQKIGVEEKIIYQAKKTEYMVTQFESIPCTDLKCRKPADVYSYSLKSYLHNCNLPICSVNFPAHIEEFLGIKRSLDIEPCLKLLACDENFYPVSDLYYLATNVNLPYKRNPNLVYIPDNLTNSETIRITTNEWRVMCQPQNQEKYELLIIVHRGESIEKIIRIKSAWITLQEIISQLNEHKLTSEIYKGNVEMLMGFQRNSRNSANDIIFNYSRICEDGFELSSNVEIPPFCNNLECF